MRGGPVSSEFHSKIRRARRARDSGASALCSVTLATGTKYPAECGLHRHRRPPVHVVIGTIDKLECRFAFRNSPMVGKLPTQPETQRRFGRRLRQLKRRLRRRAEWRPRLRRTLPRSCRASRSADIDPRRWTSSRSSAPTEDGGIRLPPPSRKAVCEVPCAAIPGPMPAHPNTGERPRSEASGAGHRRQSPRAGSWSPAPAPSILVEEDILREGSARKRLRPIE